MNQSIISNINFQKSIESLKQFFTAFIELGYDVRSNKKNGLLTWQKYKNQLEPLTIEGYENGIPLNNNFPLLVKKIHYNVEKNDENHENVTIKLNLHKDNMELINLKQFELHNNIETHHFLVQHFRIPIMQKYKLSVQKILQIAYNIGQLKADFEKGNIHDENIKFFYDENQLDKFVTYIDL